MIFLIYFCLCALFYPINGNRKEQPFVEHYNIRKTEYAFFSQRVTWDEASILCESHNGRLSILDDINKANAIAKMMAESNIVFEDAWIGGRRIGPTWTWYFGANSTQKTEVIPSEPVIDYPPWSQEPFRAMKECLAMDRRSHNHPNFVDLDCRLQRPFVCEITDPDQSLSHPVPSKWVHTRKSTFVLYHARVTWGEAVIFCRAQGKRLAVIKNLNSIRILTDNMIKSRPSFENVWVGAHHNFGQWTWLSTGSQLNPISSSGYPPWRFGRAQRNDGCLLLDRHTERVSHFVELDCDRRRDFICEETIEDDDHQKDEELKFIYDNRTFIIYPFEKSWDQSKTFCAERGSILANLKDMNIANLMTRVMGDHPKEISHIWLGAQYNHNGSEWRWVPNNEVIPPKPQQTGFPPWTQVGDYNDLLTEQANCLNLDRDDHDKPHIYGLNCQIKQPFACEITCEIPPTVQNGNWSCIESEEGKSCALQCSAGHQIFGLPRVQCSMGLGWYNLDNWLEIPYCLSPKDYFLKMMQAMSQEIQKSSGYYVLLSNFEKDYQISSIDLVNKLLTFFPINDYMKMGVTSYASDPIVNLPYNESDTCKVFKNINQSKDKLISVNDNSSYNLWYKNVEDYSVQRPTIIAIMDGQSAEKNQEYIEKLKTVGHYVIVIGPTADIDKLIKIPTIGSNGRLNLYLLDAKELKDVIDQFTKFIERKKKKQIDCSGNAPPVRNKPTNVTPNLKNIPGTTTYPTIDQKLTSPQNTEAPSTTLKTEIDTSKDGLESPTLPPDAENVMNTTPEDDNASAESEEPTTPIVTGTETV